MTAESRSAIAKRTFDLAISLPLLVVLSPLVIGLAILVRLRQGSPNLFPAGAAGPGGPTLHHVQLPLDGKEMTEFIGNEPAKANGGAGR